MAMTKPQHEPLDEARAGADPIGLFRRWWREVEEVAEGGFPEACVLSTVDPDGWPEGRVVLLRGLDEGGFSFYTNYRSDKARSLEATPRAALTFHWIRVARQVRVRGEVSRVSPEESDAYFSTRPRGHQLGAWASEQSALLSGRAALEERFREVEARFEGQPVPRPEHWGGFRVSPTQIEFWQEGEARLHDRIRFRREDGGSWIRERLSP